MKVLIDMTFVSPKSMNLSLPIAVMRMLRGVPNEDKHKLKLLYDRGCAELLHGMFPDYEYMTVNVRNMRKVYYDPRLFLVPYAMRRAINKSGCDAVFFTADGSNYVRHKLNIPSVVEINDLKWLKEDTKHGRNDLKSVALRLLRGDNYKRYKNTIENAALITTISQYTKDDLLQFFPQTPANKVHVIYLSVPQIQDSQKPSGIMECDKFILNVNSILPFKNPMTLLKAFEMIRENYKGKLVLVGRTTDYWISEVWPYIKKKGLEGRVVHLQNLEDAELRYLYEHADLFVTPSLREGFGFTPVEAAIYGCPVLSSRCESLPEATMELVNYYTPATDESALAKAIIKILSTPPNKVERDIISKTFLERYTALNHARNILKLFDMLNK